MPETADQTMNLPQVLIIGAMKSGTTSLYMDLADHPRVYLSNDKEPHSLCSDDVLTAPGLERYAAHYSHARSDQLCVDASTGYSKRPDYDGVAERAVQTLPEGFRVVYLVRHPIDRIISQHHHEYFEGWAGSSIDDEVRQHRRYISYSRYAFQLQPWLDAVGSDRVRVVFFEQYVRQRARVLHDLHDFIGLSATAGTSDYSAIYNQSQGKPVKTKFWQAFRQNQLYRRIVRPLSPLKFRLAARQMLLPKAAEQLSPPSDETIKFLYNELQEDIDLLSASLGLPRPLWSDRCEPVHEGSAVGTYIPR